MQGKPAPQVNLNLQDDDEEDSLPDQQDADQFRKALEQERSSVTTRNKTSTSSERLDALKRKLQDSLNRRRAQNSSRR